MLSMLAQMSFYNFFFGAIVGGFVLYAASALAAREAEVSPAAGKGAAVAPLPPAPVAPTEALRAAASSAGSVTGGRGSSSDSAAGAGPAAAAEDDAPLLGAGLRTALDVALVATAVLAALSILAYEVREDPYLDILKRLPAESSSIGRALRQLRNVLGLF